MSLMTYSYTFLKNKIVYQRSDVAIVSSQPFQEFLNQTHLISMILKLFLFAMIELSHFSCFDSEHLFA